jgi:hypothetical protein
MTAAAAISIISALLGIARVLTNYAEQQKWINAGAAAATLQGLQDADVAISKATKARELVRANSVRDPSSIMRDDQFKRPD